MSLGTDCPPHLAVLDDRGELVCTLCDQQLVRPCLACVVESDGWIAQHMESPAHEHLIGPAILVLLALVTVLIVAVSGVS